MCLWGGSLNDPLVTVIVEAVVKRNESRIQHNDADLSGPRGPSGPEGPAHGPEGPMGWGGVGGGRASRATRDRLHKIGLSQSGLSLTVLK